MTKFFLITLCVFLSELTTLAETENKQKSKPSLFVWANDGGEKITQEELRLARGKSVQNSIWNGSVISLFAAKNETISLNLILESLSNKTENVQVRFQNLKGPKGFLIQSANQNQSDIFNWIKRDIELFFIRYLPIKGLSRLSYETYDERHIPKRFQRSNYINGYARGTWKDRPDHDRYYPEIAVPYELIKKNGFEILANQNQSIWIDLTIPKTAVSGSYLGEIEILVDSKKIKSIPVTLEIKSFELPDISNSKTMLNLGYRDIAKRYLGVADPIPNSKQDKLLNKIRDRHFMIAHRHRISLIDADSGATQNFKDQPREEWIKRLDGSLYTASNGYQGAGQGIGNKVFSIGTYGSWHWKEQGKAGMQMHTKAWEDWFQKHAPDVERFLYLIDESKNYTQLETWAEWVKESAVKGHFLETFATIPLPQAVNHVDSLSISASWIAQADKNVWEHAFEKMKKKSKKVFMYNGKRPATGSFAIEDDGVALRELAWAQYKKNIDRWFYWESTYYNNFQGSMGETNVFKTAQTFGTKNLKPDPILGETGWNYSNGDGVLFYPGTDKIFTSESYEVEGPIASLRLKHWRRGIQDVDYLTLAKAVNPKATQEIVNRMVPKALWEYGVSDSDDPTYVRCDISWSINPDDWEKVRHELADIIEHKMPKM